MTVPDTLAFKIAHFRNGGRLVARDMDLFGASSWLAVHVGQSKRPDTADPRLTYGRDPATSAAFVDRLADAIGAMAESMPDHAAYLRRIEAIG